MINLSIIIINYNTKNLLFNCLDSITTFVHGISFEVIVVDNASTDNSLEALRKYKPIFPIKIIESKINIGFGKANNKGVEKAVGKYILFLNSDTLFKFNILSEMISWMEKRKEIAVASCALKNEDGSLQGTGGNFPDLFRVFAWMFFLEDIPILDRIIKPFHPMHSRSFIYKGESLFKSECEKDWVTGAFLLAKKSVLDTVGGFDKDYFMYTEEVDLCYRIKKLGWKVWYLPQWSIVHLGGKSSSSEFAIVSEYKGIKLFYSKHMTKWQKNLVIIFLKFGAVLRMVIYGLLQGSGGVKTYVKAFNAV